MEDDYDENVLESDSKQQIEILKMEEVERPPLSQAQASSSSLPNKSELTSNKKKKRIKKKNVWESGRTIIGLVNRNFETHIKSTKHRNRFPKDLQDLNQKKADNKVESENSNESKASNHIEVKEQTQTSVSN